MVGMNVEMKGYLEVIPIMVEVHHHLIIEDHHHLLITIENTHLLVHITEVCYQVIIGHFHPLIIGVHHPPIEVLLYLLIITIDLLVGLITQGVVIALVDIVITTTVLQKIIIAGI